MRILVFSRGVVGKNMGSTGVRAFHLARVLVEQLPYAEVTLSVPNDASLMDAPPGLRIVSHRRPFAGLLQMLRHDILISRDFPPYVTALFFQKLFDLDLYVAFPIEWNALSVRIPNRDRRRLWMEAHRRHIEAQLTLADYILCSDERQRDFWIGSLTTLGMVSPQTYERDRTLRKLIDVAPYGVQPGSPRHTRRVLKGVVPGIGEDDHVLIWNGSIMEWFDPAIVIRAMAEIAKVRDDVKLFFLGIEHPDYVTGLLFDPPRDAIALSQELGLYERSVFFHQAWVPYEEIGNYLAEADIGVCASHQSMETHYAFRTRVLDLFWAQLPIVCTSGDALGDRVGRDDLGVAVAPGDVQAFAGAVLRLIDDDAFYAACRARLASIGAEMSWERVAAPLVDFCRSAESIARPKRLRFPSLVGRNVGSARTFAERSAEYAVGAAQERLGQVTR